ncbi:MAG: hypothetical protein ACOY37_04395 [Pseudomonadota bacterium]
MDIDEQALQALWQRQQPPPRLAADLARRVDQHRRRAKVHRAAEAVITAAGAALLIWPGDDGSLSPSQWLLIPFFAVFVTVSWMVILGRKRRLLAAAHEPVSRYAQARKAQLRDGMRHLKLATAASLVLLAYATAALLVSQAAGAGDWRDAAASVVAWAGVWTVGTFLLARAKGNAIRKEYRQIGRLY